MLRLTAGQKRTSCPVQRPTGNLSTTGSRRTGSDHKLLPIVHYRFLGPELFQARFVPSYHRTRGRPEVSCTPIYGNLPAVSSYFSAPSASTYHCSAVCSKRSLLKVSLVFAANSAHSNALARQSSAEGGIGVSSGGQTEEGSLALHVVCPVPEGAGICRKCCQVKHVPAAPTNGLQLAQIGNTCVMCDSGNTKYISSIIVLSGAICYCLLSEGDRLGGDIG